MKSNRDRRVDAYIEKSAEFARPILRRLRKLAHRGCPEVDETIKWHAPFFMHEGILCVMAAFKAHCAFIFWSRNMRALIKKDGAKTAKALGGLRRVTSLKDLPDDTILLRYIRAAARLNEAGCPTRPRRKRPAPEAKVPADLAAVLRKNKKAAATFKQFSPFKRRDYVEWVTGAKRPETREKRLATAIEWLAKGKPLNWKYMNRAR